MLKALSDFLDRSLAGEKEQQAASAEQRRHGVQLATALLLVEVSRADYSEDITEHAESFRLLQQFFELSEEEAQLLIQEARQEADHAASLQAFTRKLHERLSVDEKHRVVEMLWQVALADDHLDKHEDHLVRKISDLLYVSHSDMIRIRNRVKERTAN